MKSPAKIVKGKPSEMTSYLAGRNQIYEPGMVLVDIQEKNLFNVICRWAFPFWIQPQTGWDVWVEPTWNECERWVLSGISIKHLPTLTDQDMLIIDMPTGKAKIKIGNNTIETDGSTSWKINGTNLEIKV